MDANTLIEKLKRNGHTIGQFKAMSPEGALLLNVDGRLMKQRDAEKLLMEKVGEPEIK